MRTLTPEEFKKLYGENSLAGFKAPTIGNRLADVGNKAGQTISDNLTGSGQYAGQSPLRRGVQATAAAFSTVPQGALAVAPEPIRKGVDYVSDKVGQGFNALTQKIGDTKFMREAAGREYTDPNTGVSNYTYNDLGALEEGLGISAATGEIAGNIAGAQGTVKTLTSGVNVAKYVAKNSKEAFGNLPDVNLRPTAEQIAKERGAKIRSGFEEQNTRLKSADASFNKNTITRNLPDGKKETITPIDTFAKNDIAPVVEKGSIQMGDYKTGTGALGKIKEKVQALDTEIDTKLINTGQKINIADLEKQAMEAVKNNSDLKQAGTVSSTMSKLKARFEDYRMSYGDDLDIAELNNIRKVANKDWNVDTQDASRVIGDVARDYVYDAVPDEAIRKLLMQQGELLAAKKYAETINGSKVTGGRLGNYAMRTGGAILGSTIDNMPVVGPVAGMLGGEALARLMQQGQFKSAWTELRALISKD